MLPPCRCTKPIRSESNLIVGAEVGHCAHIGHVAAETGEILAEAEQHAAGRMLVVVERVVGQP
jgi:hypothetical protein